MRRVHAAVQCGFLGAALEPEDGALVIQIKNAGLQLLKAIDAGQNPTDALAAADEALIRGSQKHWRAQATKAKSGLAGPADAVRVWRGWKRKDLSRETFFEKLGKIFIPFTVEMQRLFGLVAYLPMVLPPDHPEALPDEVALVFYKTQQAYKYSKKYPAARAYSDLHGLVFDLSASGSGFPAMARWRIGFQSAVAYFPQPGGLAERLGRVVDRKSEEKRSDPGLSFRHRTGLSSDKRLGRPGRWCRGLRLGRLVALLATLSSGSFTAAILCGGGRHGVLAKRSPDRTRSFAGCRLGWFSHYGRRVLQHAIPSTLRLTMDALQFLTAELESGEFLLTHAAEDLPGSEFYRPLPNAGESADWIFGHLSVNEDWFFVDSDRLSHRVVARAAGHLFRRFPLAGSAPGGAPARRDDRVLSPAASPGCGGFDEAGYVDLGWSGTSGPAAHLPDTRGGVGHLGNASVLAYRSTDDYSDDDR